MTSKHEFKIKDMYPDDTVEIFLDGMEVGSFNHDEHGWDGMRSAEDLVERIAEVMNWKVVRE